MSLVYIGTNYRGRDAYLAETPAKWWALWKQAVARDLPDIKLVIIQAAGNASASAGTHADGWAIDLQTWHLSGSQIERLVAHARRYGASGTWYRTSAQGFDPHIHAALDPGSGYTNSSYQIAAVRDGYNGLGRGGRGGRDTHSAPARWITAAQGITLMEQEGDDIMASKDEVKQWVKEGVAELDWGGEKFGPYLGRIQANSSDAAYYAKQAAQQTADITRPNDPKAVNGQVSLRQELADDKSIGIENQARLNQLEAKVDQILGLLEAQRG
nr:MAG TPA: signaling protein [Caudoviricetes sp.]